MSSVYLYLWMAKMRQDEILEQFETQRLYREHAEMNKRTKREPEPDLEERRKPMFRRRHA